MSSRTSRPLSEHEMQIAEQSFPELAAKSGHEAYKTTLSRTGAVVVKTSKGQLVQRRSDGTFTVIKQLAGGKRVKRGAILNRAKYTGHPVPDVKVGKRYRDSIDLMAEA